MERRSSLPRSHSWSVAEPGCKSRFVAFRSHCPLLLPILQDSPSAPKRPPWLPCAPQPSAKAEELLGVHEPQFSSTVSWREAPYQVNTSFCSPNLFPGSLAQAAFSESLPEAGRDACSMFYLATNCLHLKGITVPQSSSVLCPDACFCMKGHGGRGTSERGATVSPVTALKA